VYSVNLPVHVHAVNILCVSTSKSTDRYHHGDLRNALIAAAVGLARESGPDAIVLREAARRVGVTANAAYRHFDGLPDLVAAVRQAAFDALSASMLSELAELAELGPTGDAATDAIFHLRAIGRGYIHFALAEPGLFALAFSQYEDVSHGYVAADPPDAAWNLLNTALDRLVEVGVVARTDRAAAVTNAWATVHGLSVLLLGPMAAVPPAAREQVIDTTLGLVVRGLAQRPESPDGSKPSKRPAK
jgi:AcrR family transcriptional regulator